jgi:hypothetical protein
MKTAKWSISCIAVPTPCYCSRPAVLPSRGAYEVALANRVVPDGTELDEAIATVTNIVDFVPLALATMKRFVTGHISCRKALPSCQLASPPSSRRAQQ